MTPAQLRTILDEEELNERDPGSFTLDITPVLFLEKALHAEDGQ